MAPVQASPPERFHDGQHQRIKDGANQRRTDSRGRLSKRTMRKGQVDRVVRVPLGHAAHALEARNQKF